MFVTINELYTCIMFYNMKKGQFYDTLSFKIVFKWMARIQWSVLGEEKKFQKKYLTIPT